MAYVVVLQRASSYRIGCRRQTGIFSFLLIWHTCFYQEKVFFPSISCILCAVVCKGKDLTVEKGKLTQKEEQIIRNLLVERGITKYQLFELTGEGKCLPGSTYPWEIESLSGYVITPTSIYTFWLDWENERYSLGERDGLWKEIHITETGKDADSIRKIQRDLS